MKENVRLNEMFAYDMTAIMGGQSLPYGIVYHFFPRWRLIDVLSMRGREREVRISSKGRQVSDQVSKVSISRVTRLRCARCEKFCSLSSVRLFSGEDVILGWSVSSNSA